MNCLEHSICIPLGIAQRYTYRVLQTIQMKLILLCVWAEPAILGSAKTAIKFKYEITHDLNHDLFYCTHNQLCVC